MEPTTHLPPSPPDWGLVATESRLDAFHFTARGIQYNDIVDAILEQLPPGSKYVRKGKNPDTPNLALIEVPHDNNVGIRWNRDWSDCYVDVQGPLSVTLHGIAKDLAASYPPTAVSKWPQSIRVRRMDGCIDFDDPGIFDRAVAAARTHVDGYTGLRKPKVDQRGDWVNPVDGRTLYVGSREYVLLRIYEKGKQLRSVKGILDASEHHIRVEVETHPADAAAFDALHWDAPTVLRTSLTAINVLLHLGASLPGFVRSRDNGTRSSTVRKLMAARASYGPLFWDLARKMDSTEAAARALVAALSASQLTPEGCQRLVEHGVSAPELRNILGLHCNAED